MFYDPYEPAILFSEIVDGEVKRRESVKPCDLPADLGTAPSLLKILVHRLNWPKTPQEGDSLLAMITNPDPDYYPEMFTSVSTVTETPSKAVIELDDKTQYEMVAYNPPARAVGAIEDKSKENGYFEILSLLEVPKEHLEPTDYETYSVYMGETDYSARTQLIPSSSLYLADETESNLLAQELEKRLKNLKNKEKAQIIAIFGGIVSHPSSLRFAQGSHGRMCVQGIDPTTGETYMEDTYEAARWVANDLGYDFVRLPTPYDQLM